MEHFSAFDAILLDREIPAEPRHVCTLMVLEPNDRPSDRPFDHDQLMALIAERLDLVPRYRQVPRAVPFGLGLPVWVDDENFDLSLHVRRSALPGPGDRQLLDDLVSRLIGRPLDPEHPLWELYLIEGLAQGRIALLFKSHESLIDGSHTVDLAQVLLDESPGAVAVPPGHWLARSTPSGAALAVDAVREQLASPRLAAEFAKRRLGSVASHVVKMREESQSGPLAGTLSHHRRFVSVSVPLSDLRRVRDEHGGTVNDVILASVAGALRAWLQTRAEPVSAQSSVKALVPMSVAVGTESEDAHPTTYGTRVVGRSLALPVGEPNAVVRLHQVSYALKLHREAGAAVAANRLTRLPGFAMSTFHAVAARVAEAPTLTTHQIVVPNVPGTQVPLYLAGQQLQEVYPAVPLTSGRLVSVGVNSYDGNVYFGLVGDREAIYDLDVLGQCLRESVAELLDTTATAGRAPRGRRKRSSEASRK